MTEVVKLRPGQKGTKNLVAEHGEALVCVRYRYDRQKCIRLKTIELIVESKPWKPTPHRFKDDTPVPVHIEYDDTALREKARAAQGKWDPKRRAWYIKFGKIRGTELEKFIIS